MLSIAIVTRCKCMHTYSLHSDIAKLVKVLHLPCMRIQYIQVTYVPANRADHLAIGSIYSRHVYVQVDEAQCG